ncbi:NACHT domain-containing protein [Streptomyces sp. NPDC004065]|uniref:NACHT domain-containing protein n=1 Tax=Streptomyces sp. NPDC004065 TaxID=3364689 RepID=UPI00384B77AE
MMVVLEQLAYKIASGALKSASAAVVRSALAPKSGALIVSNGSSGRLKNKLIPATAISEKDIKEFSRHVLRVISPLLETEFSGLEDGEIAAALDGIQKSFSDTSADIFAHDLSPDRYAEQVIDDSRPYVSTLGLSVTAYEFYRRIAVEVSAQMLNFITTWPSFLARANVEQLKRTTKLAKELRTVKLAVLDNANAEEVQFEEKYNQVVVGKLDQLELFGVTLSQSEQRSYPLSTAYISLSVAESARPTQANRELETDLADWDKGEEWVAQAAGMGTDASGGLRSESAISQFQRILLRGDAGSGKTTLLHWLAVNAARRSLDGELRQFNGYVPFILPLRRFADRELPAAHEFLSEVGRHLAGDMPRRWVNRVLSSGQAFVLIDGVDELPESRRGEAKEWLCDLLNTFPSARYVVTSRPAAAEEKWLSQQDFTSMDMLPMSSLDIENFVHHWYEAARACLPSDVNDVEVEELLSYEEEMTRAMRGQRQLQKLASNPLLCALLCTLSRDRRMQLPQGRMELYAAALEMLLVRRDVERRIKHSDAPNLTLNQKQRILGHFAYWLLRNALSDSTEEQAIGQISLAMESMPAVQSSGTDVYKYLMVRSGLLRQPVEGRVDFIHRTFLEYLAAANIVALNDIGSLVKNAHLDQWHEVVAMAVGHARREECSSILKQLIDRGKEEPENTAKLHLLAASCLENAEEIDRETYTLVRNHASKLIPPSKVSQAKELASVGESVLQLLPRSGRRLLAPQAAATVRTASLVGGDGALEILAGFGSDTRKAVYEELARAWTQFDVGDYAEKVMSRSPFARRQLVIDHQQLLSTLMHFPDLRSLHCGFPIESFDWLDHCPTLESLSLAFASPEVLESIAALTMLKSLNLRRFEGEVEALQKLKNLANLEWLLLRGVRLSNGPFDLNLLPRLPKLKRLQVGGGTGRINFARLGDFFPALSVISSSSAPRVNFAGAERLENLEIVQLLGTREVKNAAALSGLGKLTLSLNLCEDGVLPELAKVRNIAGMRVHVRSGAKGRLVDVSGFAGHANVQIRFNERVKLSVPERELGEGVTISCRER